MTSKRQVAPNEGERAMATHFAPENAALTSFCGYVHVGSDELKVCVRGIAYVGGRVCFDHAQLDVEPPLAKILTAQQDTLKVRSLSSGYHLALSCSVPIADINGLT